MRNYLMAKSHSLFSPKSSIADVQLGSKYASDLRQSTIYTLYTIRYFFAILRCAL